jgi:hypothetical protein
MNKATTSPKMYSSLYYPEGGVRERGRERERSSKMLVTIINYHAVISQKTVSFTDI